MKSSRTSHIAWGLTALAAFAAGHYLPRAADDIAGGRDRSLRVLAAPSDGIGPTAATTRDGAPVAAASDTDRSAVSAVLTPERIEAVAKEAFNDPNPLTRNLAFAKLLEGMTPDNVMLVMEAMRENRAEGNQWQLFEYAWGAMDGAGAIAHAETLEGRRKERFLSQAVSGWASASPTEARAWLEKLPTPEEQDRFRGSLVAGLADHDIGLATKYVYERAGLGDKNAVRYLETVAGEEIRSNGTRTAATWAESLANGPLKGAALDRVAGSYVREDPEAAAAWAAKFATADYGARVIEEVGDEWAERDPAAAVAWLSSLPEGEGRSDGMFSALNEWTQRDPMAASQYLAAMPQSPSRDSAVSGFTRTLAREDPEAAVIWAGTISAGEARIEALTDAGRHWFRRDASAARAWLDASNLPAETRQAITRRGGRRPGS